MYIYIYRERERGAAWWMGLSFVRASSVLRLFAVSSYHMYYMILCYMVSYDSIISHHIVL